jgi:hypothetical protein
MPTNGRARRALLLLVLAAPFFLALAGGFPLCPSAGVFGIPCPGCGLSRAVLAALQGDFAGAFHYHPLFFVIAPVYAIALGAAGVALLKGPALPSVGVAPPRARSRAAERGVTVAASALLVAMLGVWGLRFAGWFGGPAPVTTLVEWSQLGSQLRQDATTSVPVAPP